MTPTQAHGDRRTHRAVEALLWVAALAAAAAAAETAARWLRPSPFVRPLMYRRAPKVGYELRPGFAGRGPSGEALRVNAAGLRGGERPDASPETIRVVALGDSFTFGLGVEERDTWPAHAEAALRAATGCARAPADGGCAPSHAVEVLNAGVPGYNLFQAARWLEHRAGALAPDVVLIGFVENDLYNLDGPDFEATPDGGLVPRPGAFEPTRALNPFAALPGAWVWLQLHSAAFREASFLAIAARLAARGDAELAAIATAAERAPTMPARLLRGEQDAETAPRWTRAAALVAEAGAAGRALGASVFLVLLPRPEQVTSARLRGGFAMVAAAATAASIEVIDPSPALEAEADRVGLFLFPRDHHPSGRAYATIGRTVASVLAGRLRRRGDLADAGSTGVHARE